MGGTQAPGEAAEEPAYVWPHRAKVEAAVERAYWRDSWAGKCERLQKALADERAMNAWMKQQYPHWQKDRQEQERMILGQQQAMAQQASRGLGGMLGSGYGHGAFCPCFECTYRERYGRRG